jgi:hypothetical protein
MKTYSDTVKELHEYLIQMFEGRIMKIERHQDAYRNGYTVALLIFIPDELHASVDELEIYRRIVKVVNVISPKEGT